MKGYSEASRFPLVDVAGKRVPRIVLGGHPYDGITYTDRKRDEAYLKRWTGPRSMVELMRPLIERFGVTASRAIAADTDLSRWHEEALRFTMDEAEMEVALILGTGLPLKSRRPEVRTYLNRLCYDAAGEEFVRLWRRDPIIRYLFVERGRGTERNIARCIDELRSLRTHLPPDLKDVEVDHDTLDRLLSRYEHFKVLLYAPTAAFEILVVAGMFDELQEIVDQTRRRFGSFFLGTHYAGIVIPMVEQAGVHVDGYLTPVNPAGIYMFPTQRHVIEAIQAAKKPIIAIKPLGGGRIAPEQAFRYIFHEINVDVAMVGIGTLDEAEETLGGAMKVLQAETQ